MFFVRDGLSRQSKDRVTNCTLSLVIEVWRGLFLRKIKDQTSRLCPECRGVGTHPFAPVREAPQKLYFNK